MRRRHTSTQSLFQTKCCIYIRTEESTIDQGSVTLHSNGALMKNEKMLVVHVLSSDTLMGLLTERSGMHFFLLN